MQLAAVSTWVGCGWTVLVEAKSDEVRLLTDWNDSRFNGTEGPVVANALPERKLIVGGEILQRGAKSYTAGLGSTAAGGNFCGGSLVTPSHVLSAAHCIEGGIRWVSIGLHYINGTQDGEQIRVVSIPGHPNYSTNVHQMWNDFVGLGLERPSQIKPVKIAAADGSDINPGEFAAAIGWGRVDENATTSYELQSVKLQLLSYDECSKVLDIDECAGGPGKSPCYGNSGCPLVREAPGGDDVLIGVVSWGDTCGRDGTPTAFGIVSRVRGWIESLTGKL
ncbi:hypothetical protein PHYSODRAFT_341723 [Phytophthora sojae]|uniref:Peptidase S1 domain-containing protein n=1 Tax=Phytophthora sojae (strain P6497) TaxID=1094619 RepID=G5AE58_PHYSP|nr:hypothetical protein PHYSODRAFT_341723 [Phytophthora sojae]EGZ06460.1 hypothetical protein PHYSODRAFT_341723 [Phytophthora sojae]|eukprot:XP_009538357.1 hypothetical protein PHYSODRAFT_341723 [Phytophthora sojae]